MMMADLVCDLYAC